jgi:Tetratricopeptide Repeats-Sensor
MSNEESKDVKGTCFVVMGFGKKTDFETGRTLNLDKSYTNIIKPAVEAAGLKCIRADEIVHSGLIDVPMYEQLLNADVVIADLSTSNKNAFYELGIRHALRPFTTVVISEDGVKTFPFDINHVVVRQYHHLGEAIDYDEAMRFQRQLTEAVVEVFNKEPRQKDSPVYTFLNNLTPPAIAAVQEAIQNAVGAGHSSDADNKISDTQSKASAQDEDDGITQNHSLLMQQVEDAQMEGNFLKAKSLLEVIRQMMKMQCPTKPEDAYIIQRLALATYKSEFPTEKDALLEARDLLAALEPETSHDTETLGLWGAVHKRLWNALHDAAYLDEAVRAYARGFYLRNDYYNGINFAYLLNERAVNTEDAAESIADFIQARRVRKEVISICEDWLKNNPAPDAEKADARAVRQYQENRYWVLATMAEAWFGLGDEAKSNQITEDANKQVPARWMEDTAREQIEKLKPLLQNSPLANIKTDK